MEVTIPLIHELYDEAKVIVEDATGEKVYDPVRFELFPARCCWGQVQYLVPVREGYCRMMSLRISSIMYQKYPEEAGRKRLKETLVHECLHLMKWGHGHGSYFKRRAALIKEKYGIEVTRTSDPEEGMEVERPQRKSNPMQGKHQVCVLECQCGWSYGYSRMTKNVSRLNRCRCPKCHTVGEFKVTYNGKVIKDTRKNK